ncbi:MAG: hypothetical protein LBV61_06550 [Burkholderiaceae bacterium]|nr:hypothetical protein [Burkholderiaceae bacterium]
MGCAKEPLNNSLAAVAPRIRAVCGVATLAHSRATGCALRLASPPEKAFA